MASPRKYKTHKEEKLPELTTIEKEEIWTALARFAIYNGLTPQQMKKSKIGLKDLHAYLAITNKKCAKVTPEDFTDKNNPKMRQITNYIYQCRQKTGEFEKHIERNTGAVKME